MRAAVLDAPGHFSIIEEEIPTPGPGEVLVRSAICGICTGEVDMYEGRLEGQTYPRFIGHEVSGEVVAVGEGVAAPVPGDRVTVYAEGKGYAEYLTVPARWAVRLADQTPYHLAVGEPIACSVNGVRKADPQLGDAVCLVGCGFMGLIMLQVFAARGAGLLMAVDRSETKLKLARRLGASHTFNPDRVDVPAQVKALTGGAGVDIGVEAAGIQATLDLTSRLVRMEGKLEVFGFHLGGTRQIDWAHWNWMAFQIVNGHTRNPDVYVEGMRIGVGLMECGKLDMEPLVTHRFALDEINRGFQTAAHKADDFVKGIITFS